jgi:glucuronoxylan 4-O-methyltransferase
MRAISRCIPQFVKTPFIFLGLRVPTRWAMEMMRQVSRIQLSREELNAVAQVVREKRPCRLLVFGAGNDSPYWARLNRGGRTIFLEDNAQWGATMLRRDRCLTILPIDYRTRIAQWREFLEAPERLPIGLPEAASRDQWDAILVDGPAGDKENSPGRMGSIYLASRLATAGAHIFVHDCDRDIERICCDRFLGPQNLQAEIELLRHYRLPAAKGLSIG